MNGLLIQGGTPAETVEALNKKLKCYGGKPVTITWAGDLCAAVILSTTEPEPEEEEEEESKPAKKKGGK